MAIAPNYGFKRMDVDDNPLSPIKLRKGCFDLVVSALWPWEISCFVFKKFLNVAKIISFSCSWEMRKRNIPILKALDEQKVEGKL